MSVNLLRGDISKIFKTFIFIILEVLIFFTITQYLGGITLPNLETTLLLIVLLSIVNGLLWPTISHISLRFLVFTLGFGTFLLDGILLYAITIFIPGVSISGISLFSIPLLLGLINAVLSIVLGIDDDSTYYRHILKKDLLQSDVIDKDGFVFLEIDGLAYDILVEALDDGIMPNLKNCLDEGTHKLTKWETDLSSQTSSSQAGILHGNNTNIPAFRWVEKENDNRIVSSNGLSDAGKIEKRISDGNGLLSDYGASRSNLFSGDAEDYMLTYSKFTKLSEFYTKTWYYLYSSPYVMARILILFIWDMLLEVVSRIKHVVHDIQPRINRGLFYFVARSGANVVMREAATYILIGDVYAGRYNVMYATYMGYDEIAHHSGIRDEDSFYALKEIDTHFGRLQKAMGEAKRHYNMIILSDHGQSGGYTFKQKYGLTLDDLVKKYLPENITIHSILYSNDDHFADKFSLKPIAREKQEKLGERIDNTRDRLDERFDDTREKYNNFKDRAASRKYIKDVMEKREVLMKKDPILERIQRIFDDSGEEIKLPDDELVKEDTAQTIVLASGNLGLIYFTDWTSRLTYEQIEDAFPGLIDGLASHEGIGFVMVKSALLGTIIISDDNVYYMDTDTYVGERFLDDYGPNVVDHLRRTDSFEHIPDILVNSSYNPETGEVHAFEELIGSHGGVGGTQQEPFIMYPSSWSLDGKIVGSENVHKFFKKEISKSLGEN